jgi:hypothetical protein
MGAVVINAITTRTTIKFLISVAPFWEMTFGAYAAGLIASPRQHESSSAQIRQFFCPTPGQLVLVE